MTVRPAVTLSVTANDANFDGDADFTRTKLISALKRFETINLVGSMPAIDPSSEGRSYEIDMNYSGDGDDRSVWWQIVDPQTGVILRSGFDKVSAKGRSAPDVTDEFAGILSRPLASTRAVIKLAEASASETGLLGNVCVVRAELELDYARPGDLENFRKCLKRTLAVNPDDTDGIALLSRVTTALAIFLDDGSASV